MQADAVAEMQSFSSALFAVAALFFGPAGRASEVVVPDAARPWQPVALELSRAAQAGTNGFHRLLWFCDQFGPRFSGTTNLDAALSWMQAELVRDGFDDVRTEPVQVPHWVRGEAALHLLAPVSRPLHVVALGGSIATPPDGIRAEVVIVGSFEELRQRQADAKGRIVLFNFPFTDYGTDIPFRARGAIEAAKAGALASLIRPLTPFSLQTLHTGAMRYQQGVPQIPHAAVTLEDAQLLQRWTDRGQRPVVQLHLTCQTLPDVPSCNVLAEIRGRDKPQELVVLGGHTDSWDLSPGAMDDAGGSIAAWEAARLILELRRPPRRTIRLVFWVNEENGLRGARAYHTHHLHELDRHTVAIEADLGVFAPTGFSFSGGARGRAQLQQITPLLAPVAPLQIVPGEGAADTRPLQVAGVPVMELLTQPDRYFWYHHTAADTPDKVDLAEFNRCVATLAVMTYVLADQPERLAAD